MKKFLMFLLIIGIITAIVFGAYKLLLTNNLGEDNKEEKEIYVNILENKEKNGELKLNAENRTIYYYFDLINYDEETSKYNKTKITPYVKLNIENKESLSQFLTWNIYKINSENDSEENWEEIVEKGDEESSFKEYYKCKDLMAFENGNKNNNIQNYVIKINLDVEAENFINLEEDLSKSFSIVLGYREVK